MPALRRTHPPIHPFIHPQDQSVELYKNGQKFSSSYDHVFVEGTTQEQVYERVRGGCGGLAGGQASKQAGR